MGHYRYFLQEQTEQSICTPLPFLSARRKGGEHFLPSQGRKISQGTDVTAAFKYNLFNFFTSAYFYLTEIMLSIIRGVNLVFRLSYKYYRKHLQIL